MRGVFEAHEFLGRPVQVLKLGCASTNGSNNPEVEGLIFSTELGYSVRAYTIDPSHSGHFHVLVFNARFRGRAALLLSSRPWWWASTFTYVGTRRQLWRSLVFNHYKTQIGTASGLPSRVESKVDELVHNNSELCSSLPSLEQSLPCGGTLVSSRFAASRSVFIPKSSTVDDNGLVGDPLMHRAR